MQGRFFANSWRPPADEIAFAAACGFGAVQLRNDRAGDLAGELRTPIDDVAALFARHAIEPTMEIFVRVGRPLVESVHENLPAIRALGCRRVHIHAVTGGGRRGDAAELERSLTPQFAEAAALADDAGLVFGFEHNPDYEALFATPEACSRLLDAVPRLAFVWDINHTAERDLEGFAELLDRAMLVHLSDARLPDTNHHLPLGQGTIALAARMALLVERSFDGPLILEIGGLPRSGGLGRDTDDALRESRQLAIDAWDAARRRSATRA